MPPTARPVAIAAIVSAIRIVFALYIIHYDSTSLCLRAVRLPIGKFPCINIRKALPACFALGTA